jgi:alkylation response protein AidB-like acyl-CoA dehydrogenase
LYNILLNEEQRMIADSVRDFLGRELPIERLRPKARPVNIAEVRSAMIDLGWFAVGLPESIGGSGLGLVEEMLVQREVGRYLASPSLLAQVLGAHVAVGAGDLKLAQDFVTGKADAAVAILPQIGGMRRAAYALDLAPGSLVVAWTLDGMGLFESKSFGNAEPDECLDDSVRLNIGEIDLSAAKLWVPAEKAQLPQRAQVLTAATLVGLAEHACDLSVAYAKIRQQFGKPIGSFQAVKHRCTDMGVRWRLAWCQTSLAALKVQVGAEDAALQTAAAKLVAADAAHENGRAAIQVHGGIGYQSECDVHWFMKRAHILDQLGGSTSLQARRVIELPAFV